MKLSGIRIYTLEELCRYLYENVYAITEETFDEKLLYWMDRITGSQALSQALNTFIAGGKPLREMVRFLLNSVSYLNNTEIAYVYNKLVEIEKQNPIEQSRMAADNYCRYGRYIAALKQYQHVIYQMNHAYDKEMTRRFKAETWHNTGITFLKLHNVSSAAVCMQRAFELIKDTDYLEAYMYTLQMTGAQDKMLETASSENVSSAMMDAIMEKYRAAEAGYEMSERGQHLKEALMSKQGQAHETYQLFVRQYLDREKKKFE
jgi:tetratricopeptide (TPR) repeat protein